MPGGTVIGPLSTTSSPPELTVAFETPYVTASLNQKFVGCIPRGIYRGFTLGTSATALNVSVLADATHSDHVAVYEQSTGYSISIRRTNGDFTLDLTSLAGSTVFIALYTNYTTSSLTTGAIRAYTAMQLAAVSGAEGPDLVILGQVVVPASGTIPAANITTTGRTYPWSTASLPWDQIVRNGSFEDGAVGSLNLTGNNATLPFWVNSSGSSGTLSVINTDGAAGSKCLQFSGTSVSWTAQQDVSAPVVAGGSIRLRCKYKRLIGLSAGSYSFSVTFYDVTGASLSTTATTIFGSGGGIDSSWQQFDQIIPVPSGASRVGRIQIIAVGTTSSSSPQARFDQVECYVQPVNALDFGVQKDTQSDIRALGVAILDALNALSTGVRLSATNDPILNVLRQDLASGANQPGVGAGYLKTGLNYTAASQLVPQWQPRSESGAGYVGTSLADKGYTPIFESQPDTTSPCRTRIYLNSTIHTLVTTTNAYYNLSTGQWTKDISYYAAVAYFYSGEPGYNKSDYAGMQFAFYPAASAGPWDDSGWVKTQGFNQDLNLGSFVTSLLDTGEFGAIGNLDSALRLVDSNTSAWAVSGQKTIPFSDIGSAGAYIRRAEQTTNNFSILNALNARIITVGDGTSSFGDFSGTTALQQAMSAIIASSSPSAVIYVKKGTYTGFQFTFGSSFKDIILIGEGQNATFITDDGTHPTILCYDSNYTGRLILQDLTLKVSVTSSTAYALYLGEAASIYASRCLFYSDTFKSAGVRLRSPFDGHFVDCTFGAAVNSNSAVSIVIGNQYVTLPANTSGIRFDRCSFGPGDTNQPCVSIIWNTTATSFQEYPGIKFSDCSFQTATATTFYGSAPSMGGYAGGYDAGAVMLDCGTSDGSSTGFTLDYLTFNSCTSTVPTATTIGFFICTAKPGGDAGSSKCNVKFVSMTDCVWKAYSGSHTAFTRLPFQILTEGEIRLANCRFEDNNITTSEGVYGVPTRDANYYLDWPSTSYFSNAFPANQSAAVMISGQNVFIRSTRFATPKTSPRAGEFKILGSKCIDIDGLFIGSLDSGSPVSGYGFTEGGYPDVYSTLTTAGFTTPSSGFNATLTVASSTWMAVGQTLYIAEAGYYTVQSIPSGTSVVVQNTGAAVNAASGTTFRSGFNVSLSVVPSTIPLFRVHIAQGQTHGLTISHPSYSTLDYVVAKNIKILGNSSTDFTSGTPIAIVAPTSGQTNGGWCSGILLFGSTLGLSNVTIESVVISGFREFPGYGTAGYSTSAANATYQAIASCITFSGLGNAYTEITIRDVKIINVSDLSGILMGDGYQSSPLLNLFSDITITDCQIQVSSAYQNLAKGQAYNFPVVEPIRLASHSSVNGTGIYNVTISNCSLVSNVYQDLALNVALYDQNKLGNIRITGNYLGNTVSRPSTTVSTGFSSPPEFINFTVQVADTSWMAAGMYVVIPGFAYCLVVSITDNTHVVLQYYIMIGAFGDSVSAGTTIYDASQLITVVGFNCDHASSGPNAVALSFIGNTCTAVCNDYTGDILNGGTFPNLFTNVGAVYLLIGTQTLDGSNYDVQLNPLLTGFESIWKNSGVSGQGVGKNPTSGAYYCSTVPMIMNWAIGDQRSSV
jgi:hypothetical protein